MNFIDKRRIRKNPNIIDSFNENKINQEVIEYAIDKGYQFNVRTIAKFVQYDIYVNTFKMHDEFIQYQKELAIETGNSIGLYEIYGKNIFIEIVKQDNRLAEITLNNIEHTQAFLGEEDILEIIEGKAHLIDIAIKKYSHIKISEYGNKELAKYIASVKTPQQLKDMGIENSDFYNAFIETANPEKIMELMEIKDAEIYMRLRKKDSKCYNK